MFVPSQAQDTQLCPAARAAQPALNITRMCSVTTLRAAPLGAPGVVGRRHELLLWQRDGTALADGQARRHTRQVGQRLHAQPAHVQVGVKVGRGRELGWQALCGVAVLLIAAPAACTMVGRALL